MVDRTMFRQTPRIDRWSVVAVVRPTQKSQQDALLGPLMRRMGYSSQHYPGPCSLNVKEGDFDLPPGFIFLPEKGKPFAAVFSIAFDKIKTRFAKDSFSRSSYQKLSFIRFKVLAKL